MYFWCYQREPRRRSYNGVMAIPHVVRSVEEVTEDELDNICTNVREKVYSSSMVSLLLLIVLLNVDLEIFQDKTTKCEK